MMGCVPVDMSGKAIRPAIIWADQRSTAQADALLEQIPAQEFYRITGHRASASYSIEKLMWIRDHEPDSFSRIYRTLQPKDYLVCKLTGRFVTDYSDASSTNALDLSTLTWSDEILKASKLDPSLFPDLMPSTAVIGELTASVAKECGLAAGTPIVLGAGDGVCAATGAASVSSGDAYHYLGSSSWIAYTADAPLYDPEMRTFNWVHMVPGKFCPTGTMQAAGNSFNYIRDMLCDGEAIRAKANGQTVYDAINRMLRESPIGSRGIIYLPYLLGERSPRWNPIARGAYIGLTMEHSRSDLVHHPGVLPEAAADRQSAAHRWPGAKRRNLQNARRYLRRTGCFDGQTGRGHLHGCCRMRRSRRRSSSGFHLCPSVYPSG